MEFRDVLHVLVDSATFAGDSIANNDLRAEAHTAVDDYLGGKTETVHPDQLAVPVDPAPAEVTPQSLAVPASLAVPVDPAPAEVTPQSLDANQQSASEVAASPPDSTQPAA